MVLSQRLQSVGGRREKKRKSSHFSLRLLTMVDQNTMILNKMMFGLEYSAIYLTLPKPTHRFPGMVFFF